MGWIWEVDEEGKVAKEILEGVPKSQKLFMHMQNIAQLYVCEDHETLSPWLE